MATAEKVNISAACRQLGYSKQAYYKSLHIKKIKTCKKQMVKESVLQVRAQMPVLGTRKLYFLLKEVFIKQNISIGRDRLFDLLREEGLLIKKKPRYVQTTNSKHWLHKYSNLVQDIELTRPEQLWVADITYVAIEGNWCYLHLITDAYSKQIIGYHVSDNLTASSTVKALQMALKNRKYKGDLIHHSDRGLQYCCALYTRLLQQNNITISMTQTGSPYDNAIAERVNGILKIEFGLYDVFPCLSKLEYSVKQSVQIYNDQRPHLSNHYLTPNKMHSQSILIPRRWHKKNRRTLESSSVFLPSALIN